MLATMTDRDLIALLAATLYGTVTPCEIDTEARRDAAANPYNDPYANLPPRRSGEQIRADIAVRRARGLLDRVELRR